ncbi:MAG: diaminobutyrate--2-oxoglutarate transaminase [Verrucomicrobiales bacterium]|nr:diaminobutyrate--2-oxoglutarate transaminase [Verrucomicrobiales bacterium]
MNPTKTTRITVNQLKSSKNQRSSAEQRSVSENHESEAKGYCRKFKSVFEYASGSTMRDADGKEYIDFLAACGSLNYGHNDPDMGDALISHIRSNQLTAGLDLHNHAKADFMRTFVDVILKPRGMDYRMQFTGPTGTNAVEAAMKLARKVTGRTNIVSFTNGFHGVSLGSLAATGNKFNRMGGGTLSGVTRMPYDNYMGDAMDTAAYLDKLLSDPSGGIEAPAAFVLETVQGEGGLNAASKDWLQKIAAIAKKHGALLIVDDIQAGCGRTGTFFSFEKMGIEPDIITLSKSISGYGLPMSLVLIKPEHDQWAPAEHNGTFRGNCHAFLTSRIAIEKYWSDDRLEKQIATLASVVKRRLRKISKLIPGSFLKGRGMMQGLSVGSGALSAKICALAFEKGLIVETSGPEDEVIKILAPLTITVEEMEKGFDILHSAAAEIMGVSGDPDRETSPRVKSQRAKTVTQLI